MLFALAGIGLLAGVVAGISPCILPVLPVLLATSTPVAASEGAPDTSRRRPIFVIAGLVSSFAVVTLLGSYLLSKLHLPQSTLEDVGLVLLGVLGLALIVPWLSTALERPFTYLARGARARGVGGRGFLLGASLGLVFVPCAGPVLATITTLGAAHRFGLSTVVLTASYSIGTGIPLLAVASAGDALTQRLGVIRTHAVAVRRVAGVVLVGSAVLIGSNVLAPLQRAVPGYDSALQKRLEATGTVRHQLQRLTGNTGCLATVADQAGLAPGGCVAPAFRGISTWLNTPGDRPLSLSSLRGHVVLIDFWTYSCINCQRTLPHLEAWDTRYRAAGLTVIGVHTPEFAFEHSVGNIRSAAANLGVKYPIAVDNSYSTWNAYHNEYWPAEYLIDESGQIRHIHFGEGDYSGTESLIRRLLPRSTSALPPPTNVPDTQSSAETPESYLGYDRIANLAGETVRPDRDYNYRSPAALPADTVAFAGAWRVGRESADAIRGAKLLLRYSARDVYLVLAGHGTVRVTVNHQPLPVVQVFGVPTLYRLVSGAQRRNALLTLSLSPGLSAYDFTFG